MKLPPCPYFEHKLITRILKGAGRKYSAKDVSVGINMLLDGLNEVLLSKLVDLCIGKIKSITN